MSSTDKPEPFVLANERPAPKREAFDSNKGTQRVLFTGMDCLPGQLDLFATDNTPPKRPAEGRTDDQTE